MKFDVTIGNPPYNDGVDIKFIAKAYQLSSDLTIMVTPAKWQTAKPNQSIESEISYGQFRKTFVPHMNRVVFYPDCKDVFDIFIPGGITCFVMDKDTHEGCLVDNRCGSVKAFNSMSTRSILDGRSLHNVGDQINKILKDVPKFNIKALPKTGNFDVWISTLTTLNTSARSCLATNDGNLLVLGLTDITDRSKYEKTSVGMAVNVFRAKTLEEAKSFESYIQSKFVRFMVLMNIASRTIIDDQHFRFVPVPSPDTKGNKYGQENFKFDHIYTDKELYRYYDMPQRYIDIIEEVIKEREI